MLGKLGLGEVASPISLSLTALLSSTKPQLSSQHLLQLIHGKTPMSYIQRFTIRLMTMTGTIAGECDFARLENERTETSLLLHHILHWQWNREVFIIFIEIKTIVIMLIVSSPQSALEIGRARTCRINSMIFIWWGGGGFLCYRVSQKKFIFNPVFLHNFV